MPFVLSGLLTPGHIGDGCVVEVKRPGSARWSYSSNRLTYAMAGAGAKWWYRYTPKVRGTYQFQAKFSGNTRITRATSSIVGVSVW